MRRVITIELQQSPNKTTNFMRTWLVIGSLVRKAICSQHSYETKQGIFKVSVNKTVTVREL